VADRTRTALLAGLGACLLAVVAAIQSLGDLLTHNDRYLVLYGVALAVCGAAAVLLWRRARRLDVAIVLTVALVARALIAFDAPSLSDDAYRFVWDGRVQAEGINPYAYAPADGRLHDLRDFPVFTRVNRPYTRTGYPPANEVLFFAVNRVAGEGIGRVKLALLALEALAVALLLALLGRTGRSHGRVALYAWHPLAIVEVASSAHLEPLVLAAVLASLLAWDRGHALRAGAALGAGVLTKFVPILIAPFMLRRLGARFAAAAAFTCVALFAPYAGAGTDALGSVGAYGNERFGAGPFRWLTEAGVGAGPARALLLAALVAGVALSAWRPPTDLVGACRYTALLLAGSMLASNQVQPWYLLWVLPLLCVVPIPGLAWAAATAPLLYLTFGPHKLVSQTLASVIIWAPTVLLLAGGALRGRPARPGLPVAARAPT